MKFIYGIKLDFNYCIKEWIHKSKFVNYKPKEWDFQKVIGM